MDEDLRETLGASIEQHAEGSGDSEGDGRVETQDTPPAQEAAPSVGSAVEDAETKDEKGTDSATGEDAPVGEQKAEPVERPSGDQPAEEKGTELPRLKAPAAWRPGPREKWSTLPPEVQAEVSRREKEIRETMHESADSKQVASQFKETIQPFMQFIEADQSTPMEAVKNLMQTAAGLRVGTQQQKAAIVADVVQRFGVDIATLDSMLAGKYQQNPLEAQLEQRLKPMQDMMAQMQARESQLSQQIGREAGENIEAFGEDPANEFFEDVRADMADIIDLATQRGQKMSLKQAYDRAIMMNEEIADVVSQRKLAETIQQSQKPVQAAKRAAVSVTGAPTVGAAGGESGSLRDSILNAMDSQS